MDTIHIFQSQLSGDFNFQTKGGGTTNNSEIVNTDNCNSNLTNNGGENQNSIYTNDRLDVSLNMNSNLGLGNNFDLDASLNMNSNIDMNSKSGKVDNNSNISETCNTNNDKNKSDTKNNCKCINNNNKNNIDITIVESNNNEININTTNSMHGDNVGSNFSDMNSNFVTLNGDNMSDLSSNMNSNFDVGTNYSRGDYFDTNTYDTLRQFHHPKGLDQDPTDIIYQSNDMKF